MMDFFILFANCIVVKGAVRSTISDLQRNKTELIPNDMAEIIYKLESKKINDVLEKYDTKDQKAIQEYIDFLVENEYGFYGSPEEKKLFPKLEMTFELPQKISNAVIEIKSFDINYFKKIFFELDGLHCTAIHIIFLEKVSFSQLRELNKLYLSNCFQAIELAMPYCNSLCNESLTNIDKTANKITRLIFYNSPKNIHIAYGEKYLFSVDYTIRERFSNKSCGNVSMDYFHVNKKKFLEAINFNSCLYKKISIDVNGNIKNCPSMPQSFGNITNTTLQEALDHPDFKKYWNITKDQIAVCKDCEFRYICTDCRAYLENPKDQYSKPLKCGYDPYTNQWEEWSTNPLKQKAIEYYGMQDLVKKDA